MSPEVFLHQPYDFSCDIWGLGLIFYELAMMKYALTSSHKALILNYKEDFYPPRIDFIRRRYDPKVGFDIVSNLSHLILYIYQVQNLLEMMVQRDPKKRASIQQICVYPLLKSARFYNSLNMEDRLSVLKSYKLN